MKPVFSLPMQDVSHFAPRLRPEPVLRRQPWRHVWEGALLIIGCGLIAAGFDLFLRPNGVASGGVLGLSLVLSRVFPAEPGVLQWVMNALSFVAGYFALGRGEIVRGLAGATLLPLFVVLGRNLPAATSNVLLAALYGGIIVGAGVGLVFKSKGSIGGVSLVARILEKHLGLSLGRAILLLDGLVVVSAGFAFGIERAMFALIAVGVCGRTIDAIQVGFDASKFALIVSENSEAVSQAVLHNLDRGLTRLHGAGGFSNASREVLLIVLPGSEVTRLKSLVRKHDPKAFMILSDTAEVLGHGFHPHT